MGAYILRRLLLVIPTLLGVMIINFTLTQFVPGGPIEQIIAKMQGEGDVFEAIAGGARRCRAATAAMPDAATTRYIGARGLPPEFIAQLEKEFGFDKPPLERFLTMMWNYMRFDFGESYFRSVGVLDLVLEKMPVSITLGLWSTLLAYIDLDPAGHPQGGARRVELRHLDLAACMIAAYAIPGFLFAVLLLVLFAGGSYCQWFPLRGLTSDNWSTSCQLAGKVARLSLAHHPAGDRLDDRPASPR